MKLNAEKAIQWDFHQATCGAAVPGRCFFGGSPKCVVTGWWCNNHLEKSWSSSVGTIWNSQLNGKMKVKINLLVNGKDDIPYIYIYIYHYIPIYYGKSQNSMVPVSTNQKCKSCDLGCWLCWLRAPGPCELPSESGSHLPKISKNIPTNIVDIRYYPRYTNISHMLII